MYIAFLEEACLKRGIFSADFHPILRSEERFSTPVKIIPIQITFLGWRSASLFTRFFHPKIAGQVKTYLFWYNKDFYGCHLQNVPILEMLFLDSSLDLCGLGTTRMADNKYGLDVGVLLTIRTTRYY
jgi:hypothetical protein